MNKFEFISYTPTPGEKHLGIAAVTYHAKLILRYKIVPTKDGNSFFPVPAAYKIGDVYAPSFILDSNIEKDEVENLIKAGVKKMIANQTQTQPSTFQTQSPPMNYGPTDMTQQTKALDLFDAPPF